MSDEREDEARAAWLARHGWGEEEVEPLAGDVSARRYFRVRTRRGSRAILAEYPVELTESCRRFVATTRLLSGAGLRVPEVLAADLATRRMLIEDLGPETLYDRADRDWSVLEPLLARAVAIAASIARLPRPEVAALGSPPLDEALLRRELVQTSELFLAPRRLAGDGSQSARLDRCLDELCRRLAAEPAVPCHRDFMARNLVPLGGGELAVLDHQDLRLGPPAYDLASLLNDSLFPPPVVEERLLAPARAAGLAPDSYARATAQRALKAVGTFAACAARGNPRHLPLVPDTFGRAVAALLRLPESAAIAHELAPRWQAFLGEAGGSATLPESGRG